MDEEDFIKIEHESPVKATYNFANIYMNHFYDQDSCEENDIIKKQDVQYSFSTNTDQIIQRLEQFFDIRTTSLQTLISFVKENFALPYDMDWYELERNIKKRKLLQKRNFAKNRELKNKKQEIYIVCDNIEGNDIEQELQAQIKKKRNRMSAQISRDRRKIKIQQLQANNKKLKAETQKIIQENQKLKKQLEQFNRVEQKKIEASKGKNKFLSILIMLGMFFLFTIIRDTFKSNQSSVKAPGKLSKQDGSIISAEQQTKIIQDGQRAFKEMQNIDQPLFGGRKILENMIYKLEQIKLETVDLQVSKSLKQEIEIIKRQVS